MQTTNRLLITGLTTAIALLASGKQNPPPPNTLEVAVSSSTVPAGGTAQVQFSLTEPHPISSTGAGYDMSGMSVNGVAVFSPLGDAGGVGVIRNGKLYVTAISPAGSLGTNVDYPFLTITSTLSSTMSTGMSFPLTLGSDSTISTASGPTALLVKPGKLTVGGSVSIHGVYPGGGTWPAGTVVRMLGSGFSTNTHLQLTFKTSSILVPNSGEIDFVLKEITTLDSQKVIAVNPDGSTASYFCYLRGVLVRQPSRALLLATEPAFPLQTHAVASLVVPAMNTAQFAALALQNPNTGPLVVTFELDSASGGVQTTSVILPSGGRLVDDLSSLLNGAAVFPGDTVKLSSTAPVQILGILGDESAVTVTPFFPNF